MTREYAGVTKGYSLPLCRSIAFNPDLEESMNSLNSLACILFAEFPSNPKCRYNSTGWAI